MLDDGFKSDSYSPILDNLKNNGYLNSDDVSNLLKEFHTTGKMSFTCIDEKKALIVTEALIDNYNRMK